MSKINKKAIIYCRQSSGKEEDSESIAFQEESCRKFAASHGFEVIGVFQDANTPGRLYPTGAEGIGEMDAALNRWLRQHTTDKKYRPGLGAAIAALQNAGYLLIYDRSRLYRPVQNSYLGAYINDRLLTAGAKLISVKEGCIDFSNFTDSLVSSITSQVNDNQISLTREKSKCAMAKIQDDGYYCTLPRMYGIRYIGGKDREIEVIPEYAEVIRFVYDSVLKHCKYTELLKEMNTRFKGRHGGRCFYDSSWRHIIENPFYCGYMYDSHGALIKAKQMQGKEIVTFEEWKKANEIAQIKHGTDKVYRKANHPFSGLMICGHCGSKMSITEDGGKICYSCLQGVNVRHEAECSKSRANINLVRKSDNFTGLHEAILPLLLLALYKALEMRNGLGKYKRSLEEKKILLTNLEKRQAELVDGYIEGVHSQAAYYAAFERLNVRIASVKNDIIRLNKEMEAAGNLEKKAKEYLDMVDKVMNNQLEEHEFTELLHLSIKQIKCFDTYLDIETVYGTVKMRRYIDKKFRNFPKYTYRIISTVGNKKITNLDDCKIHVTYLYDDNQKEELVVDLSVMEIYQK